MDTFFGQRRRKLLIMVDYLWVYVKESERGNRAHARERERERGREGGGEGEGEGGREGEGGKDENVRRYERQRKKVRGTDACERREDTFITSKLQCYITLDPPLIL